MSNKLLHLQGVYATNGNNKKGLECPRCGCSDLRTSNTIRSDQKTIRYKTCRNCGKSIRTTELIG